MIPLIQYSQNDKIIRWRTDWWLQGVRSRGEEEKTRYDHKGKHKEVFHSDGTVLCLGGGGGYMSLHL